MRQHQVEGAPEIAGRLAGAARDAADCAGAARLIEGLWLNEGPAAGRAAGAEGRDIAAPPPPPPAARAAPPPPPPPPRPPPRAATSDAVANNIELITKITRE